MLAGGILALDEIGRRQEERRLVSRAAVDGREAVLVVAPRISDDLKDDSRDSAKRTAVYDDLAVLAVRAAAAVADGALYDCVGWAFAVSALAAADFSALPADGDAKFFNVSGCNSFAASIRENSLLASASVSTRSRSSGL